MDVKLRMSGFHPAALLAQLTPFSAILQQNLTPDFFDRDCQLTLGQHRRWRMIDLLAAVCDSSSQKLQVFAAGCL